jgi:hypothetical protein
LPRLTGEGVDGLRLWPIPGFDPRIPSTSFEVHGTRIRLDLLTPMRGRSEAPVHIEALGASATPLRYLDYLVEESEPAVIVGGAGVLVNVPDPSRFALHELLVADARNAALATKSRKELLQAEALLRVLLTDRDEDVRLAWKALEKRGPGWTRRVTRSIARLEGAVVARLSSTLRLALRSLGRPAAITRGRGARAGSVVKVASSAASSVASRPRRAYAAPHALHAPVPPNRLHPDAGKKEDGSLK